MNTESIHGMQHTVEHNITCGNPLPQGVEVETVQTFQHAELIDMLIQKVINRLPYEPGTWGGHVEFHCRSDDATVTATVSVWKPTQKGKP